jgi:hypothetical protein
MLFGSVTSSIASFPLQDIERLLQTQCVAGTSLHCTPARLLEGRKGTRDSTTIPLDAALACDWIIATAANAAPINILLTWRFTSISSRTRIPCTAGIRTWWADGMIEFSGDYYDLADQQGIEFKRWSRFSSTFAHGKFGREDGGRLPVSLSIF